MIEGITLALDGSTYSGSAAVLRGGALVAEAELPGGPMQLARGQEDRFFPMVVECLARAGVRPGEVSRVLCGAGPGSFTSLRVTASLAKGIAVGAGAPLFAVSSLLLMVAGTADATGRYLAVLPAMRGEAYAALFALDDDGGIMPVGPVSLIAEDARIRQAADSGARLVDGLAAPPIVPHARSAARVLEAVVAAGQCDLETWEPAYGRLAEAQVKWEAAHGRPLMGSG